MRTLNNTTQESIFLNHFPFSASSLIVKDEKQVLIVTILVSVVQFQLLVTGQYKVKLQKRGKDDMVTADHHYDPRKKDTHSFLNEKHVIRRTIRAENFADAVQSAP